MAIVAVKPTMLADANETLRTLFKKLEDEYGEVVEQFFVDRRSDQQATVNYPENDDDDDQWFQDDDIDKMIKTGILKDDFIQFLNGNVEDKDKQSVLSWGTGDTNYTDLETITKDSASLGVSSITPESEFLSEAEVKERYSRVKDRLDKLEISREEVDKIIKRQAPYELVMSGIRLPAWRIETEMMMISGLLSQLKNKQNDE